MTVERTAEEIARQIHEALDAWADCGLAGTTCKACAVIVPMIKRYADQQTAALRERLADLVKGMPVFKDSPEGPEDEWGVAPGSVHVTVGAVRRARAALAPERGEG